MARKPLSPPPYRTPFLDWDSKRLSFIDGRQSFYKGGQVNSSGSSNQGSGGTLISHPWLIWLNELINFITNTSDFVAFSSGTQAEIPTNLGPDDADKRFFYVSDYDHLLRWTGTDWLAVDYDAGVVEAHISTPTTAGRILCDGVGTTQLMLPDGTLSPAFPVPNLIGSYMKMGAAYSGPTPTAAVAPTLTGVPGGTVSDSGGSITGTATAANHDHDVSISSTTGIENSSHEHTVDIILALVYFTSFASASEGDLEVVVPSITGTADGTTGFEDQTHDHNFSVVGTTEESGALAVDVSGLSVTLGALTYHGAIGTLAISSDGEPQHNVLKPYLRL